MEFKSLGSRLVRRFFRDKAAVAGSIIIVALILLAAWPALFAPTSPTKIDVFSRLSGPTRAHIMGTDELGRDIFSRVVYGTRVSLKVALGGVSVAAAVGVLIGLTAAMSTTRLDNIIMRLLDVLFAFPAILLALTIMAALGSGVTSIITALAIVYTPRFARIARGAALVIRETPYREAAQALGASRWRIIWRHLLPNIAAPVFVQYTVDLGFAIQIEATLSFLGMGVQPPTPAWGAMLFAGKSFMELSPWIVVGPGVAIALTVLGFNILGDGLRDVLDPKLN